MARALIVAAAALLLLSAALADSGVPVITAVKTLQEVPGGTKYNDTQPAIDDPKLYKGMKVIALVSHGCEDIELTYPVKYFTDRGAEMYVGCPWWLDNHQVLLEDFCKPTYLANCDYNFTAAAAIDWDIVYVPGGAFSARVVRNDADAVTLIKKQFASGRILAPICAGSETLINAGIALGRRLTGSPDSKTDLLNAGARYQLVPTVTEGNLITGQGPTYSMEHVLAIESYVKAHKVTAEGKTLVGGGACKKICGRLCC